MGRVQLVELEDLPWLPEAVRNGGTDWLAFMANRSKVFSAVAPKIRRAMAATATTDILDLCSGGGGPWLTLERELAKDGPVRVELSDLYPNLSAFRALQDRSGGRIHFRPEPVDATNVPHSLTGVRTMFNSFHHFPPGAAAAILADAVRKRRAIAVFEGVSHRVAGLVFVPLQLPVMLVLTPFMTPLRWSRLLFTYVIPLIPLLVLVDGIVSMLRLYLPEGLWRLVRSVPGYESFEWDIGITPVFGTLGITHLVGVPREPAPDGARVRATR